MKSFPKTGPLLKTAQRVVWFKDPAETLEDPLHFLAHVMTYGTPEDIEAVFEASSPEDFKEALEQPPPRNIRQTLLGLLEPPIWNFPAAAAAGTQFPNKTASTCSQLMIIRQIGLR
jgi:hypothetical protein